jgi:Tfp pilus assembly protein PilF
MRSHLLTTTILAVLAATAPCAAQFDPAVGKQIDSLIKVEKWEQAKTLIEENYSKAPNDQMRVRLNWLLSVSYSQLNDPVNASSALYRVLALNPKIGMAWGNLGWNLYLLGKIDSAQAATEKALALDSTLTYAVGNLGLIQLRKGKDVAMKTYKRAGDMMFEMGDINSFKGIYDDLINEKDNLQKNKKLYEQVVAYLDSMKDLIQQKSDLEPK